MTNAIWRWKEGFRISGDGLEQAYASMLESKLQEVKVELQKAQESLDASNNLLEQEKHLRDVIEGAYMEARSTLQQVQQVAGDSKQCCAGMAEKLIHIKCELGAAFLSLPISIHVCLFCCSHHLSELSRRFRIDSPFSLSTGTGFAPLASASQLAQLSKDDIFPHLQREPTHLLLRKLQQLNSELAQGTNRVNKNCERMTRGVSAHARHVPHAQLVSQQRVASDS